MLQETDIEEYLFEKAFPLAFHEPPLSKPTDSDSKLAHDFCPQLYVKPKLFNKERKFLIKNLDKEEIAEALFLFGLGRDAHFERIAAQLRILGPAIRGIPEKVNQHIDAFLDKELWRWNCVLLENLHTTETFRSRISGLINRLLVEGDPTCVIKYRVDHLTVPKSAASSKFKISCIQYFVFWPIQLGYWKILRHPFDYEPIYVFLVRKKGEETPLLISVNANALVSGQHIKLWKRWGHIIKTYLNWNLVSDIAMEYSEFRRRSNKEGSYWLPIWQFDSMTKYMTEAFGGKYLYQKIGQRDTKDVLSPEGYPQFQVTNNWHSFENYDTQKAHPLKPVPREVVPLKLQDLLHIEWNVRNPFQVPFLYPTVGKKKNPLKHLPFSLATLLDFNHYRRWNNYASMSGSNHLASMTPNAMDIAYAFDCRRGLFIKYFQKLTQKDIDELWERVEQKEWYKRARRDPHQLSP